MKIQKYLILSTLLCGILMADIPGNWEINPADYENYMTVTAVLDVNNVPSASDNIVLGAFVEDECRGYTYPILVGEQWMYFLMLYANTNNEIIEFEVYDADNDLTAPAYDFITFENSIPFGSPDLPHTFYTTLSTILLGDVNFDTIINILDIVIIVNIILPGDGWNGGNPPNDSQLAAADINQDGTVNVLDIVIIVNIILPDALSRQILWYYDDAWTYETLKGEETSTATLFYNQDYLGIRSNGEIAGIELMLSGDYTIENNNLPSGWEFYHKDGKVLMYSLDGSKLDNSKLFEYTGDLTITSSIVADWYGSDIVINNFILPDKYNLSNAYPNPFNPITNFSFTLPEDGHVSVEVFNLKGQLIDSIYNGFINAGEYHFTWNAEGIVSGTYFLNMNAGSYHDVQKVVLMK